jgi:hypothetical protein
MPSVHGLNDVQIEQLTQQLSSIELELEKCRLDVDGMTKQEAQLTFANFSLD